MAQDRNSRSVRDVMTLNPESVSQDARVQEAARIMKEKDTGVVPVVDGDKKVVGLITDRDIVVRGLADGKDCANMSVKELMTKQVRSVREDEPVDKVLTLMSSAEVRRVPVVNSRDELVGIVSLGDIAVKDAHDKMTGDTLEKVYEGVKEQG